MKDSTPKRLEKNYASDIRFYGELKGHKKGLKYKWVAHSNSKYPDIIFLNKSKFWTRVGEYKVMIRVLKRLFGHEPIHCILWDMFGVNQDGNYDYIVNKFRKKIKKECPKTYSEWSTF